LIRRNSLLLVAIVINFLLPFSLHSSDERDINSFLDKVAEKLEQLANNESHSVKVVTIVREMDGNYKLKKLTKIEKIVTKKDSTRHIEIVRAIVTEKGKEKDITEKVRKKTKENDKNGNSGFKLTGKEFFPFSPEQRKKFNFSFAADTIINGKPFKVLEVHAREMNEKLFNGIYYINPQDYSLIVARLSPSKNPKMVKKMNLNLRFDYLDDGRYVIRNFRMSTFAKFLFKKYRFDINESYVKYQFF